MDESGELGFAKKSSKYFIITLLSCSEDEAIYIRRIMKRVREKIIKKKIKKIPELKGNNSSDRIRTEVLNRFVKTNAEVFTIVLDKSKVYDYLKSKKNELYNYLTNIILSECAFSDKEVFLIVDKSKSKRSLRDDFDRYISFKMKNRANSCNLLIKHENSQSEQCLQVLDFISWAIFRKYESNDECFFDIIRDKITTKKEIFK